MFYIVGEYGKNYFVYDTDDNSCELVSMHDLKQSGVVVERVHDNLEFAKLRMMYNLQEDSGFWGKNIVSYTIPYKNGLHIGLTLVIFIIRIQDLVYDEDKDFELDMYYKYGYMSKYAAVACYRETKSNTYYNGVVGNVPPHLDDDLDFSKSPVLTRIELVRHMGKSRDHFQVRGMIIPLRMFDYTMRLAQQEDLLGIFRAYAGLFDKRLIVNGVRSAHYNKKGELVGSARVVSHIVWGSTFKTCMGYV